MLPVLVVRRFDADSTIVGFFFAAFGAGALGASILASQVVRRVPLLRLAAVGILGMAAPLWLLALDLPWPAVIVVLAAFGFCVPFVNVPVLAIVTVRPPEALRPKVVTAVMTISVVIGPLGFLAVGQALQYLGMTAVFLAIAAGFTVGALAFAAALRRGEQEGDAVPAVDLAAVPAVEARAD
jgi:predicted MFS family arabinose efflux permease